MEIMEMRKNESFVEWCNRVLDYLLARESEMERERR